MTGKRIIQQPSREVTEQMRAVIQRSNVFRLKRLSKNGFYLLSHKNYGSLSMLEKEYYHIKGMIKQRGDQTELRYEIKGNATYRTMAIILPIMMLPTLCLGVVGEGNANCVGVIITYLILSSFIVFGALYQERRLERLGEQDLNAVIRQLKTSN